MLGPWGVAPLGGVYALNMLAGIGVSLLEEVPLCREALRAPSAQALPSAEETLSLAPSGRQSSPDRLQIKM